MDPRARRRPRWPGSARSCRRRAMSDILKRAVAFLASLCDEGIMETPDGPLHVYSFHLTLSYSRDPFCCFVTSMDLVSFWDCHIRAFEHFGGVPASIVYDRTKTVVRRHVGRGGDVPLHPEAVAFAAHYG